MSVLSPHTRNLLGDLRDLRQLRDELPNVTAEDAHRLARIDKKIKQLRRQLAETETATHL